MISDYATHDSNPFEVANQFIDHVGQAIQASSGAPFLMHDLYIANAFVPFMDFGSAVKGTVTHFANGDYYGAGKDAFKATVTGVAVVGAVAAVVMPVLAEIGVAADLAVDLGAEAAIAADGEAAAADAAAEGEASSFEGVAEACLNSFVGSTRVLLADGSTKPIAEVRLGDKVQAEDPLSGNRTAREVAVLHRNQDTDLADVLVSDGGGVVTIHTTQGHPFWDATTHTWTVAADLRPGDKLDTVVGDRVSVVAVRSFTGTQTMFNLTVDTDHTYYVIAGTTPVLVHNDMCTTLPSTSGRDTIIVLGRRNAVDGGDINVARDWPGHEVLSLPQGTWGIAKNDAWVAGAIAKGQKVYLASPIEDNASLYDGGPYNWGMTVYSREISQFMDAGYTFDGDYMIPPPLTP